jgi:hypothetical protein
MTSTLQLRYIYLMSITYIRCTNLKLLKAKLRSNKYCQITFYHLSNPEVLRRAPSIGGQSSINVSGKPPLEWNTHFKDELSLNIDLVEN